MRNNNRMSLQAGKEKGVCLAYGQHSVLNFSAAFSLSLFAASFFFLSPFYPSPDVCIFFLWRHDPTVERSASQAFIDRVAPYSNSPSVRPFDMLERKDTLQQASGMERNEKIKSRSTSIDLSTAITVCVLAAWWSSVMVVIRRDVCNWSAGSPCLCV